MMMRKRQSWTLKDTNVLITNQPFVQEALSIHCVFKIYVHLLSAITNILDRI